MINNNPFMSETYVSNWKEHINNNKTVKVSKLEGLEFIKFKYLPIYYNACKNMTKGVSYSFSDTFNKIDKYETAVFLIYDVPEYFDIKKAEKNTVYNTIKIHQYPGYLINIGNYDDIETYLKERFSKNTLYKLRKCSKRLELCFNIEYVTYFGDISLLEYNRIFYHFRILLKKRFKEKRVINNNLYKDEWKFFESVSYPMIQSKQASLFVIYDNKKPISITLRFHSNKIIFDTITVFDIDYQKFRLGSLSIIKMLDWAFKNNFKIFDLCKGHLDYKEKWSNIRYSVDNHIIYNKGSFISKKLSFLLITYFKIKAALRRREINTIFYKLLYSLRFKKSELLESEKYVVEDIKLEDIDERYESIPYSILKNQFIIKEFYSFLFINCEPKNTVNVYKNKNGNDFIFCGNKYIKKISIINSV